MNREESDSTLALRSARGDHSAYSVLVRRHSAALVQAARSFGIPETDIDDVLQETFVTAWRALDSYDASRPFRAWLFSIGMNKMRDLLRFRKVRHFLFSAFDLHADDAPVIKDDAPGPEREVTARRDLARISSTLSRLDRSLREAIVLTAIVGMSQPEAAAALGITSKAIEGRVTRARAKLQQLIEGERE